MDQELSARPDLGITRHLHACSHTTFSCNVIEGGVKTNVIPDEVRLDVDIRTLPGEGPAEVEAHLRAALGALADRRSEEHTSELQSLMRISYAVFCLKKKKQPQISHPNKYTNTTH